MVALKDERFSDFIAGKNVLLKFHASWCGSCRPVAPIVKDVSEETGVEVVEIDVDTRADVAAYYGISSIPAVIGIKNGEPIDAIVGSQKYEKYLDLANKVKA